VAKAQEWKAPSLAADPVSTPQTPGAKGKSKEKPKVAGIKSFCKQKQQLQEVEDSLIMMMWSSFLQVP
jgi:hypothetical protein